MDYAILYINGNTIPVRVEEIESSLEGKKITLRDIHHIDEVSKLRYKFDVEMRAKYNRPNLTFLNELEALKLRHIKEVIFNGPATIIRWTDNTKTVVKCQPDDMDNFDYETGIALAVMKKVFGNKGNFNTVMKKLIDNAKYESKEASNGND